MTTFVTFFCVLFILSIGAGLALLAKGRVPNQLTLGQLAFQTFVRCIYLGWALWLIAQTPACSA